MLDTAQHTNESSLDTLGNSALEKIIAERTSTILSKSEEAKELQDALDTRREALF